MFLPDAHAEAVRVRRLRLRRAVLFVPVEPYVASTDEVRDLIHDGGNILSLGSTGFLTGFMAQAKGMFKGTRLVATCVYLGSMVRNGEPDRGLRILAGWR